ncbi:hypothetical protein FOPG_18485 [Fusarium oxysporum f. sp. conglutinans race 2 54008]|uniref:Uncharacterized protein n=2 Tax=Fusarium oxysporum TaxID=5507 RepID=A0A0J9VZH7_FUSO4|nr:hypothetical protein FOXG_21632 [Fusarium oxysporum f. sp. lycopersici 4287]EXL65283.1 hypothetical protein FOPG_18485 [Fusarium oxysporum f. sp. conglutinans race 2 54008]KAI8398587.1 hypothetical protein FOFC_19802 [Fusarium oxysporum]KNB16349.1 hypothetical protein FOXG_21632 [Fusarium oxysporum f. sp. lycopersici 4287]
MANNAQVSCGRYKWVFRMALPGRLRCPDNHITKARPPLDARPLGVG